MIEDKCPTCPKYGTGEHCECNSRKGIPKNHLTVKNGVIAIILIALVGTFFSFLKIICIGLIIIINILFIEKYNSQKQ